jgi:hypothetical protein
LGAAGDGFFFSIVPKILDWESVLGTLGDKDHVNYVEKINR